MFSLNKIRNAMYRAASLLGDVNAISRGTIIQRLIRKFAFRHFGQFINKLFK